MYHRIEVGDKELVCNGRFRGKISTHPLEGIRSQISVSSRDDITIVQVQWKIKKPPQPAAPLELLKVELTDFVPRSMFISGRRYESAASPRPPIREKGFPYNTYYKFRIRTANEYDAALHAKLPLVCWQGEDCAFSIVFPKFVALSNRHWPAFLQVSGPGQNASFSLVLPDRFEVQCKPYGWFSAQSSTERYTLNLSNEHLIEVSVAFLAATGWPECVRKAADFLFPAEEAEKVETGPIVGLLERTLHFYGRTWDNTNKTHVHLPIKNFPEFESIEYKHSHITDDFTKLVLYRRLINAGWQNLLTRERELLQKIKGGDYLLTSDGDSIWHSTTYFNGSVLEAFTHHGTGFVGFPGGVATNVRRLCEYAALSGDKALVRIAESGAQWLRRLERQDGSWPAVFRKDGEEDGGCIASTAECACALLAAYRLVEKQEYLTAAESAVRYINRDESFFECRQYLRDVGANEADGITAEACIHANLDLFAATGERQFLEQAEKWGCYSLQWVRPFHLHKGDGPAFDGLSRSITPRVDVWGGLLIGRALIRLGRVSGERGWESHAWRLFGQTVNLQERDGGLCETWFYDFPEGIESIHIEPTFVTDAFVEFMLDATGGEQIANELSLRKRLLEKSFPLLQPIAPIQNLVALSKTEPEFIVDRRLRLAPAFSGLMSTGGKLRRFLYRKFRTKPLRPALKIVPALKILLSRHRVHPPSAELQPADHIKIKHARAEHFGIGRQRFVYSSDSCTIILSIDAAGMNDRGLPGNDIGFAIEMLAGDASVEQVRIDLSGDYTVKSISKDGVIVFAGGTDYSMRIMGGSIDGFLQQEKRLAFDISLSANWNFFGKYLLRMRVERMQ
ncbi:MAG: hypothetical protein C4520_03695 [Candidatus Abyssobacteria bacterium SURF_5]|uniref:Uncharacterized protein n=1 Tax=Abyssobacteria bacterium (strain SURF_5) TaxID=2093360 RepID=A0A3A4P1I1_ABYX5|nr:MAG: hypothetical protein C4520_03695 [Candidatus Abyssubacteria bacterium SURF_5]